MNPSDVTTKNKDHLTHTSQAPVEIRSLCVLFLSIFRFIQNIQQCTCKTRLVRMNPSDVSTKNKDHLTHTSQAPVKMRVFCVLFLSTFRFIQNIQQCTCKNSLVRMNPSDVTVYPSKIT
ncbi:hypothetical protein J6590_085864 [Homalodisca vitripennis]|nr:hypothetical protein J6590_085864 [Homalodisca vitripennis]